MTTYTITAEQRETLIDALEKADSEVVPSGVLGSETEQAIESAIALLEALQPNTQEPRTDTAFGGPKAREQTLNQLVHPAPQPNTQEPVAWGMEKNGLMLDIICPEEHEAHEGGYTVPLYLHPTPQQPAEVAALQAKVNAAEARERQTRATLHKYMANQQQAEPVSHEL